MTSNVGSECFRKLSSPIGFYSKQVSVEQVQGEISRELERRFSPEFRNRIDEVVIFRPLTKDEVREIALQQIEKISRSLAKSGRTLTVSPEALEQIVTEGYSRRTVRGSEASHREPDQTAGQSALDRRDGVDRRRLRREARHPCESRIR